MSQETIRQVFLDANVVIRSGKPPGGPEINRVADLVEAEMVKILTTDLTIFEVAKKHAENDYNVIKEIGRPHFRKIVEETVGAQLPDVDKPKLKEKLNSKYQTLVAQMFQRLQAEVLQIDEVKPTDVFLNYTESTGFFRGDGKKNQFPDAFIFECLKKVDNENLTILIVSDDGDFTAPAEEEENLEVVKSLPDLFSILGFEIDSPPVQECLVEKIDTLIELVEIEVNDWGLIGDIEDSEIYNISVSEINIGKIAAFKPVEESDPILAISSLVVVATVEYTHPNWDTAMYDSEDKVLIPFEDAGGEAEVEFEVEVSISVLVDENGQSNDIGMLWFRNSDFQYVTLQPDYEY